MKIFAKKWTHTLLVHPRVLAVARKLLRPFPAVKEEMLVWDYLIKKKLLCNSTALPLSEGIPTALGTIPGEHKLLIDVSELVLRDLRTGIQRVVRSILQELLLHPPAGYRVEPVYADTRGQLRYASKLVSAITGKEPAELEEPLVSIQSGDIFFCPDYLLAYPFAMLSALQQRGLRIIFTVYDIIALSHPGFIPKASQLAFPDWFAGVMTVTDAIVCDSRAVADEVRVWLKEHPGQRTRPLSIGYFHLGADIEASQPMQGPAGEGATLLAACGSRPTLLMVGTLEPRKGHAQALAAVEALWKEGVDLNLVIIGKEGWHTQRLIRQLRRHPERNERLFWLKGASDTLLLQLYARASALLAASFAEGFGLPLIEAARQGLPIIARGIPVFREVASEHAFYFQGETPEDLTEAIRRWLVLYTEDKAPSSKELPWLTWAQSTRALQDLIVGNQWYKVWQPHTEEAGTGVANSDESCI